MSLVRFDKTSRLTDLPKLKSNSFFFNKKVGYTGSRITRSVKGSLGVYRHHGFIYGFDFNHQLRVIENNENGVECISFRDFVLGYAYIIEHNTNPLLIGGIMQRTKERAGLPYNSRENNCEHFVNYCLGLSLISNQVTNTEAVANVLVSVAEIYLVSGNIPPSIINKYTDLRKVLKLQRPDSIEQFIEENIKRAVHGKTSRKKKTKKTEKIASPINKKTITKRRNTKPNSDLNN